MEQVAAELAGRVARYTAYPQLELQLAAVAATALITVPTTAVFQQLLTTTEQALETHDKDA